MNTEQQLAAWRAETAAAAAKCLRRAAGQHGVLELPIQLNTPPVDPPEPCNAATLFQIHWHVDRAGRIRLRASIDGLIFQDVFT